MSKLFLTLIAFIPMLAGCHSPVFILEPFEAHVVDAETGEPIEGAFIVANWALFETGGTMHTVRKFREQLEVKETVTDKNGHFAFAGFTKTNPKLLELYLENPQVIIFKPGYEYSHWVNSCRLVGSRCPTIRHLASVAGQTVKLKKLRDQSLKDEKTYTPYSGLSTYLSDVLDSCNGQKIPNFILAASAERARTDTERYIWAADLPTLERMESLKSRCGVGREYFESYKK